MADREAKVKLIFELVAAGKTAEAVALINKELDQSGQIAQKAAGQFGDAAAATNLVTESQESAAEATADLAGAMSEAGTAATETGQETVSAASGSAQAVGTVVTATEAQTAATRGAGAAARDSGDDVERAAKESHTAIDQIIDDWKETIAAAKAAGLAFDADFQKQAIEELAAAIRRSNADLESQKSALEGLAAGVVEDFGDVEKASKGAGDETTDQAKLIQGALANVRQHITDVETELANVGAAGSGAGAQVETSFISVDAALKLANKSAADAAAKLEETGRLPKAAIKELAEIIETVNIAMERAANTSGAATGTQIANADALKSKLAELNVVTQRQVDASGDNAAALKDGTDQAFQLTSALTGLVGTTNTTTGAIANLAGRAATGAANFEKVKNAVAALNLNTLSLGKVSATSSVQFGALLAALAAGVTVGSKLSKTNKENVEATDSWWKSLKRLRENAVSPLKDEVDGLQAAGQGLLTFLIDLSEGNGIVTKSSQTLDEKIIALGRSFDNLAIATRSGRTGVDIYHAAVRDGLTEQQAWAIALDDSGKVLKFYRDSLSGGAEGHDLWNRALRESQGDVAKLGAFVKDHNNQMRTAVEVTARATTARTADTESVKALAGQLNELDRALGQVGDTSRAMLLQSLAASLSETAGNSVRLTTAERERLAIIVEILSRGDQMTAGQEKLAASLLSQARAGKAARDEINLLARLYIEFDQATEGTTKKLDTQSRVLAILQDDWEHNSQRMKKSVEDMQAVLDATDNLSDKQRAAHQRLIDGLRAVDAERERIAELEAARTARFATDTIDAENAVRAAIQARLGDLRSYIPLSDQYGNAIRAVSSELADLTTNTSGLGKVERERLEIIATLTAKGEGLNTVERQMVTQLIAEAQAGVQASAALNDLAQKKIALAEITDGVALATNGSTVALNLNLDAISKSIASGEQHSVVLGKLAAALTTELSNTDGLTAAQRKRIETIAELVSRSEELTAAEKKYVTQLIAVVEAGNRVDLKFHDLVAAEKARTDAIHEEIAALQEQIDMMERQQGVTKEQTEVNLDQGVSIDYLRQKQAALQREVADSLTVWSASSAAKKQEADIDIERLARMAEEAKSYERVRTAHQDLIAVQENGRTIYTNLTEAQRANITVAGQSSEATLQIKTTTESLHAALDGFRDRQSLVNTELQTTVTRANDAATAIVHLTDKLREMNDESDKAMESAGRSAPHPRLRPPD